MLKREREIAARQYPWDHGQLLVKPWFLPPDCASTGPPPSNHVSPCVFSFSTKMFPPVSPRQSSFGPFGGISTYRLLFIRKWGFVGPTICRVTDISGPPISLTAGLSTIIKPVWLWLDFDKLLPSSSVFTPDDKCKYNILEFFQTGKYLKYHVQRLKIKIFTPLATFDHFSNKNAFSFLNSWNIALKNSRNTIFSWIHKIIYFP